jgi:osmotically-inducible protein OsmY
MESDPDWDDSHWTNGQRYWLGQRYYRRRFWQSVKTLLGFSRADKHYPDNVVADEVCDALAHEPEVDMNEIEVDVKNGHVTLRGRALDHWMKQQAEDVIYFLPGVRGVSNEIQVRAA